MAQLKDWLYRIVVSIAWIHDWILKKNRHSSAPFTDKQLHFIILGLFGLCLFLLAFLLFRYLAKHGHVGIMAWLFTLSTVVSVCFAIEIGQHVTKTGSMQFDDIVYGIAGFLVVSACIALLYLLFCVIKWLFRK